MRRVCVKLILSLALLLITNVSFSQVKLRKIKVQSGGLAFSPNCSYRHLDFDTEYKWIEYKRNALELPNFGFSAGATVRLKLFDRLNMEAGIYYTSRSLKTIHQDLIWATPDPQLPVYAVITFAYRSLDLPVKFQFYWFDKTNFKIFTSTGVSANVFLNKKTTVTSVYANGSGDSHSSRKDAGYQKLGALGIIGVGFCWTLNPKIQLQLESIVQYFLNSIVSDPAIEEHLYSGGVNVSLNFLLR